MALGHPVIFESMTPLATTLHVKNLISIYIYKSHGPTWRYAGLHHITSHHIKLHKRRFNRYIHQLFIYIYIYFPIYIYIYTRVYARVLMLAFDRNRYIHCITSHYIAFQRLTVHYTTMHAYTLLCITMSMYKMHMPARASIRIQIQNVTRTWKNA